MCVVVWMTMALHAHIFKAWPQVGRTVWEGLEGVLASLMTHNHLVGRVI